MCMRVYLPIENVNGSQFLIRNAIPISWITEEITSRGPQVADMECREAT
jgi:hypothetical protein